MFDRLISQCLAEEPQALALIAQKSLTKIEIDQAVSLLKSFTSKDAEYSNALYLLGLMKVKKKQYAQAFDYLEDAIAMANSWAMNLYAYMHDKGLGGPRDVAKAIQFYEQAIALGNSGAMNGRAYMYYEQQDYKNASLFYEKAIELKNSLAMVNRAEMYELGEGEEINYAKAINLYDKAIGLGNGLAMGRRAYMHKNGIGGSQNLAEAGRLFYQAYDKIKHKEYLEELKDLPLDVLEVQLYLILAYLPNKRLELEAQKMYLANSVNLAPLLVEKMIKLLNDSTTQSHLIQNLRSLLLLEKPGVTFLNIWPYAQFKLRLFDKNCEKAYQLYINYPQMIHQFTASDWNELGKQVASDSTLDSLVENKLCCLNKACTFFYQAFKKDKNNDAYYESFRNVLREKEALEASLNTAAKEPQSTPFIEREIIPPKHDTKEIEALSRYLKSNHSKSNVTEQELVYFLIRRLSYNFSLEASLRLPHLSKQLYRAELLYHTLKNLLPADSSALKPLITDEACKALLEIPNCGQGVYEALHNYALTLSNLKILTKAKDKVALYMEHLVDRDKTEGINALFKRTKNDDAIKAIPYQPSSTHKLFKPFIKMRNSLNHFPKQNKR